MRISHKNMYIDGLRTLEDVDVVVSPNNVIRVSGTVCNPIAQKAGDTISIAWCSPECVWSCEGKVVEIHVLGDRAMIQVAAKEAPIEH